MNRIAIFIFLILSLTGQVAGADLSITVDQEVLAQGDTVTFRCNVKNYVGSLVSWYKKQGEDDAVKFATNDEVNDIFSATGRYSGRIESNSGDNIITFVVTIAGVVAEDSGDIGCDMKNTDAVYVHLSVLVPISEIHLYGLDTSGNVMREFQNGDQMVFNEGDQYYFQCAAVGGNPAPSIDMSLAGTNVNERFVYTKTLTVGSGKPGLKQVHFEGKMTTKEPITIHKDQNALEFKCSASVDGTEELTISVLPVLKFAPVLTCEKSQYVIPLFTADLEVLCKVKADPSPDHVTIYWQERDGTNISISEESNTNGKYRMGIMPGEQPDEQVVKVHIERIFPQMFREYTFLAESSLGTDRHVVTLVQDVEAGASSGSAWKRVSSAAVTFFSILQLVILLGEKP